MQALRERLALQTCRVSTKWSAFLSKNCWAPPTASGWKCTVCVRSPQTSCCSHVAPRVCTHCRCKPDSSPHASPPLYESCTVAFDAHTVTLLILVTAANKLQLVSLRRNASEWLDAAPHHISYHKINDMVACNSHVLLTGGENQGTLFVFDVNVAPPHTLRDAGSLPQQTAIYALACTRATTKRSSHLQKQTQCLCTGSRHAHSSSSPIVDLIWVYPNRLLFRGELLLVADMNSAITGSHTIVSFRATGNALTEQRVLLDDQDSVVGRAWLDSAGDRRLVLAEWKSESVYRKSGDLYAYGCMSTELARVRHRRIKRSLIKRLKEIVNYYINCKIRALLHWF